MAYKKYCDTLYGEGNGLDNELRKRVELAMRNEVFKEAQSAISNHISSEVYDVYDPVLYERRYILEKAPVNKDLYDDGDITLNVFSSAEPAPSVRNVPYNGPKGTFAQWINDGSVNNIFNDTHYVWEDERPFYKRAVEELEATESYKQALADGLLRRGVNIT